MAKQFRDRHGFETISDMQVRTCRMGEDVVDRWLEIFTNDGKHFVRCQEKGETIHGLLAYYQKRGSVDDLCGKCDAA